MIFRYTIKVEIFSLYLTMNVSSAFEDKEPVWRIEFTSEDLYTIGAVIVFLILLMLLFCKLFCKRRRTGITKIAATRDYV